MNCTICSNGGGHVNCKLNMYLKWLKLSMAALYVSHVFSAIEACKSRLVSNVKSAIFEGREVEMVLDLRVVPRPRSDSTDNEKENLLSHSI